MRRVVISLVIISLIAMPVSSGGVISEPTIIGDFSDETVHESKVVDGTWWVLTDGDVHAIDLDSGIEITLNYSLDNVQTSDLEFERVYAREYQDGIWFYWETFNSEEGLWVSDGQVTDFRLPLDFSSETNSSTNYINDTPSPIFYADNGTAYRWDDGWVWEEHHVSNPTLEGNLTWRTNDTHVVAIDDSDGEVIWTRNNPYGGGLGGPTAISQWKNKSFLIDTDGAQSIDINGQLIDETTSPDGRAASPKADNTRYELGDETVHETINRETGMVENWSANPIIYRDTVFINNSTGIYVYEDDFVRTITGNLDDTPKSHGPWVRVGDSGYNIRTESISDVGVEYDFVRNREQETVEVWWDNQSVSFRPDDDLSDVSFNDTVYAKDEVVYTKYFGDEFIRAYRPVTPPIVYDERRLVTNTIEGQEMGAEVVGYSV